MSIFYSPPGGGETETETGVVAPPAAPEIEVGPLPNVAPEPAPGPEGR